MAGQRYLLDTDTLVFLIRSLKHNPATQAAGEAAHIEAQARRAAASGAAVCVSAVTVSELEYGARKSENPVRERRAVTKILAPFELLAYDAATAPRHYGEVRAQLERDGTPIGAMDLMIAAHARSLGAVLVTNNTGEFARVDGLRCENWAR